jgi:carbohydrate diacid regulator
MRALPVVSTRFVQVASIITERVAELLYAPVMVADDQGVILTSSDPQRVGLYFDQHQSESVSRYLRIPLHYDTQIGEVIVGEPLNQEPISPRLAQVLVELVINQTATLNQLPNPQKFKNQLIYDLLHGRVKDEIAVLRQAKDLGMDLAPPRAVILIDATDYVSKLAFREAVSEVDKRRKTQLIIGSIVSFFHLPNDTICADLGEGEIAVLKASDTKNLRLWAHQEDSDLSTSSSWANLTALRRAADALLSRLRSDTGGASINLGIGRYHPGIRGLAQSYQDAQAALSLGSRFQGQNRVHCLGRLGVAAFVGVADEATKVDLAKYLLSPLDHEPDLLMTLDVFFAEDCCPSSTAKRLSIHRNTLGYRLDKIASLTGLDPRRFDDAVQMRLCLLLRSLRSQSIKI